MLVLGRPAATPHAPHGRSAAVVGATPMGAGSHWADSGGRRNAAVVGEELSEFFGGSAEAQALAGAVVELGGDGLEPRLRSALSARGA